ncbi:MAG: GNAT family N-acetyltransferase [Rhodobacteraceae bacterium]|nr:GNAT family N-acetyltransferase [Paracoccaceae bacterium]
MLENGIHDVPRGRIAVVITHLAMTTRPEIDPAPEPDDPYITPVAHPTAGWYRDLFFRVGGRDWLWASRLRLSNAALEQIIQDKDTHILAVFHKGRAKGLAELRFDSVGACELSFFGLSRDLIGQGIGHALMTRTLAAAWSRPITRLTLATCTADSPRALTFYQRHGFQPTRQQIEIADDPRLDCTLPETAGPHVPIFRPESEAGSSSPQKTSG